MAANQAAAIEYPAEPGSTADTAGIAGPAGLAEVIAEQEERARFRQGR